MRPDFTDIPEDAVARGWRVARLAGDDAPLVVWDGELEWAAFARPEVVAAIPTAACASTTTFKEAIADAGRR